MSGSSCVSGAEFGLTNFHLPTDQGVELGREPEALDELLEEISSGLGHLHEFREKLSGLKEVLEGELVELAAGHLGHGPSSIGVYYHYTHFGYEVKSGL